MHSSVSWHLSCVTHTKHSLTLAYCRLQHDWSQILKSASLDMIACMCSRQANCTRCIGKQCMRNHPCIYLAAVAANDATGTLLLCLQGATFETNLPRVKRNITHPPSLTRWHLARLSARPATSRGLPGLYRPTFTTKQSGLP